MNLELIETHALLDELLNRFEHAVFAGLKVNEGLETQYEIWRKTGNDRTCQGLACSLIIRCEERRRDHSEPTTGDT